MFQVGISQCIVCYSACTEKTCRCRAAVTTEVRGLTTQQGFALCREAHRNMRERQCVLFVYLFIYSKKNLIGLCVCVCSYTTIFRVTVLFRLTTLWTLSYFQYHLDEMQKLQRKESKRNCEYPDRISSHKNLRYKFVCWSGI